MVSPQGGCTTGTVPIKRFSRPSRAQAGIGATTRWLRRQGGCTTGYFLVVPPGHHWSRRDRETVAGGETTGTVANPTVRPGGAREALVRSKPGACQRPSMVLDAANGRTTPPIPRMAHPARFPRPSRAQLNTGQRPGGFAAGRLHHRNRRESIGPRPGGAREALVRSEPGDPITRDDPRHAPPRRAGEDRGIPPGTTGCGGFHGVRSEEISNIQQRSPNHELDELPHSLEPGHSLLVVGYSSQHSPAGYERAFAPGEISNIQQGSPNHELAECLIPWTLGIPCWLLDLQAM